ncbi:hypothetical protein ABT354_30625 [Streptomyces sp. NPDC000594]|uniref:hypothetical protein n=1 Tax=Streptomyces sp. NPDC000594 TaxID=3154261 RepID=UPI0033323FEE
MTRERTAHHLLGVRLEQLRGQSPAQTDQPGSVPWTERLSKLAARPLDGDTTTGPVIA